MKLLKITDNTQVKKDDFSEIGNLTGRIANKTLEQLEREGVFVFPKFVADAEDITKDQMILQNYKLVLSYHLEGLSNIP